MEKEPVIKLKVWVTEAVKGKWVLKKASGFKPSQTEWTDEELNIFLKENSDVEPILTYA